MRKRSALLVLIFILFVPSALYSSWYFVSREEKAVPTATPMIATSYQEATVTPEPKLVLEVATVVASSVEMHEHIGAPISIKAETFEPTPTPSFVTFEKTHHFMMGFHTPDFPPEDNLREWEEQLQVNFELVAWYQHWDQSALSNKLKYTCSMGKIPVITWESWNGRSELSENGNPYPLWDIASGVFDELLIEQFTDMKQTAEKFGCSEVWIRFDHEMSTPPGELHWYPWQGDPENYIAAWQHVVTLSREVGFNQAKWIFSPAWGNEDAILYYPGKDYVDFIGLTKNQYWHDEFDLRFDTWEYRSLEELYQVDKDLESWGHPIVIVESATGEGPQADSKAVWIKEALEFVDANEHIIGFVWYNVDSAREFEDIIFRVDSSEASIESFQDFFND